MKRHFDYYYYSLSCVNNNSLLNEAFSYTTRHVKYFFSCTRLAFNKGSLRIKKKFFWLPRNLKSY